MFEDVGETRKIRKRFNSKMFRSGISVFDELERLEGNALKGGEIPQKFKELIALGISISHSCYG